MSKVMYMVALAPSEAILGNVKRMLQLADAEIDERFGVMEVDPKEHLYAIMVDSAVAERLTGEAFGGAAMADPTIESTGLDVSG